MKDFRHIAIEGPIGVGKSSLARKLAAHFDAELLLEKPEENPFLARFYEDGHEGGNRYALQTQLFFLFQRIDQYRALAQPGMFTPRIVSDFMFAKDALFARLTLSDDEYRLYQQIHAQAAPQLPRPDAVVWLRATPQVLLGRIRGRAIPMEQDIDADYLQRLSDAYADHFAHDPEVPLLAIDTDEFNPIARESDFRWLLDQIERLQPPRP